MMYWGNHMGTGDWIFSIFGTLIIVALIFAAIYWVVSAVSDRGGDRASRQSALEILDRRLAGGELTIEQYSQLRAALADEQTAAPVPRPPRPASMPG
jgi:uncharacterized membrane protein